MEETHKIETGIKRLDRDTGGFIAGKMYLVSGGANTAKTVFAAQYLRQGLLADENALILTDKRPEDYLAECGAFGFDFEEDVKSGRLVLLKYLFQSEDVIKGEEELSAMAGELERFVLSNRVARAAVDSAVPVFRLIHGDWFEKGIKVFRNEIEKLGATLLMTSRMPADRKALETKNIVEANVSGSIHLDELTKNDGSKVRKMAVRSMSHLRPPYPVYEFDVETGEGIVITSRSGAGLDSPREKVLGRAKGQGVSFSREYSSGESAAGKAGPPEKEPGKAKKVSFSDGYDIGNEKKS